MTAIASEPAVSRPFIGSNMMGVLAVLAVAYLVPPLFGSEYWYNAILAPFLALGLAALGLQVLSGYAGQVSLASAAFMAIGAFTAYNLNLRVPGLPMVASLILAGTLAPPPGIGLLFALPAFRLRGVYSPYRHSARSSLSNGRQTITNGFRITASPASSMRPHSKPLATLPVRRSRNISWRSPSSRS